MLLGKTSLPKKGRRRGRGDENVFFVKIYTIHICIYVEARKLALNIDRPLCQHEEKCVNCHTDRRTDGQTDRLHSKLQFLVFVFGTINNLFCFACFKKMFKK